METNKATKPDLLTLVAVWEFIAAFLAFIGIGAIIVFAFPAVGFMWLGPTIGTIFGLSVAIFVLLAYVGLSVAGGIGLLNGKEWGRIMSIVQAALSLLSFPFGTTIGILVIIYLSGDKVKNYFLGTTK